MPSDSVPRSAVASRIPVDVRRFPWIRKLAADYAFNFPAVSRFFAGDPAEAQSWRDAIARTQACQRPRAEVVDLLLEQQSRRNAPTEARAATNVLRDPKSVAIVTGQQAGLFGGPLFTLLKSLTALKLVEELRSRYGTPAAAVFWIDAEDHDWDEVSSCTVLDTDLRPRTVTLPAPQGAGELPVASVRLDDNVLKAIAELDAALPATEFTAPLIASLSDAYRPGRGMTEAFGRWLETTLGARGLIVFDSSDPAAKPLVGRVFARELESPERTSQLAASAGAELVGLGYHAQVMPQDGPALFHLDGRRHAVRKDGNDYIVGAERHAAAALQKTAVTDPKSFSPNVLLRPIGTGHLVPDHLLRGGTQRARLPGPASDRI